MERLLTELAQLDLGEAILTDVGSAKGNVVRKATEVFGAMPARFVPGHPIAGSEQSGVTAAKGSLFRRHKVILTPVPNTAPDALDRIDALWRALGADVEHMDVEHHDEVLAATSHLPHLLAFGWWIRWPGGTRTWRFSATPRAASATSPESPGAIR